MQYRFEVFVLPVSDVDKSKAFYEGLGWNCDVDHQPNEHFRVVQFTPPGSGCSVTFGVGMPQSGEAGTYGGMHLCVDDVEAACGELRGAGVDVAGPFHFGAEGQAEGVHPERPDFGTFASFDDPDGNTWLVQEVPSRNGMAWQLV